MKKILSFLVLAIMAITGGRCFATAYDLWVGGVLVTSSNASNITGTHIQGSVSFNPETYVLTLNQATIEEPENFSSVIELSTNNGSGEILHLTIELIGDNYLYSPEWRRSEVIDVGHLTIQGSGSLTIEGHWPIHCKDLDITGGCTVYAHAKKFDNTDYPVAIFADNIIVRGSTLYASKQSTDVHCTTIEAKSLTIENSYMACPSNYEFVNYNMIVDHQIYKGNVLIAPGDFQIWVKGVQVTPLNASNVLGDGRVSFDWYTNTLTLNDAAIVSSDNGIQSLYDELTINLVGDNAIHADYNGLYSTGNLVIQGEGSLDVDADWYGVYSAGGDITFQCDGTADISGGWYGIYANGGDLIVKNGTELIVFGTQYYAIVGTTGKKFSIQNSTVTAGSRSLYYTPIQGFTNLEMSGCGFESPLGAEWDATNHYVTYNGNPVLGNNISIGASPFPVKVAGQMVTVANYQDVLGDGTVSYDFNTHTLTLHNAYIVNDSNDPETFDGITNLGIDGLTIELVGQNTIKKARHGLYTNYYSTILTGSGTLTIGDKVTYGIAGHYPGSSLTIEQGCKVYVDCTQYGVSMKYGTLTVNNTELRASGSLVGSIEVGNLNLNDTEIASPADAYWDSITGFVKVGNKNVKETVIIKPVGYDLMVGGVRVDHANRSDVLGDGTVSYDFNTHTLTLHNAYIVNNSEDPETFDGISNLGIDGLTIELVGQNTIKKARHGLYTNHYSTILTGSGTLTIGDEVTYGIAGHYPGSSLTIEQGCKVYVDCTQYGVSMKYGTLTVNNTELRASGSLVGSIEVGNLNLNDTKIASPAYAYWDSITGFVKVGNQNVKETVIIKPVYDLWVGGVRVDHDNRSDILGDGTVSYNNVSKILTLNNANITFSSHGIINEIDGLKIELVGHNSVFSTQLRGIYSEGKDLSIFGTGSLYVSGYDHGIYVHLADLAISGGCSVTAASTSSSGYAAIKGSDSLNNKHYYFLITESNVTAGSAYQNASAIEGFYNLILNGSSIYEPTNAEYSSQYYRMMSDDEPCNGTVEILCDRYDLTVGGVQVTKANAESITGPGISGTVTYNALNHTLTLTDAIIETDEISAIWSNISGLIIELVGDNTIVSTNNIGKGIFYENNVLNIRGEGSLEVHAAYGIYAPYNQSSLYIDFNFGCRVILGDDDSHMQYAIWANNGTVYVNQSYVWAYGETASICCESLEIYDDVLYSPYSAYCNGTYVCYAGTNNPVKNEPVIIMQPLIIGNTFVDAHNCNDVLNDGGSVRFDFATSTLYLNNATIEYLYSNSPTAISSYINGLTVHLQGVNNVSSQDGHGLYSNGELTIEGPGELTIWGNDGNIEVLNGNLTLRNSCKVTANAHSTNSNPNAVDGSEGYTLTIDKSTLICSTDSPAPALNGFSNLVLNLTEVTTPLGAEWDSEAGYLVIDGNMVDGTIIIGPVPYHIIVAGIEVTSVNCNDVLYDGSVRYDVLTNTLVLDNAHITCFSPVTDGIENVGADGLTIWLEGYNYINANDDGIDTYSNATTITGPGELYIASSYGLYGKTTSSLTITGGCYVEINATRFGVNLTGQGSLTVDRAILKAAGKNNAAVKTIYFTLDGCNITSPTGAIWDETSHYVTSNGVVVRGEDNYVVIKPLSYNLWVAEVQVNEINANDVLGDGTVAYDAEQNVLTLTNAAIQSNNGYGIHNEISNLTIQVESLNAIVADYSGIYSTQDITIQGTGMLMVSGSDGIYMNNADLTIESTTLWATGTSTGAYAGIYGSTSNTLTINHSAVTAENPNSLRPVYFGRLVLSDECAITEPAMAGWTNDYHRFYVQDGDSFTLEIPRVSIAPVMRYDLWVGGNQVNSANAANILGDGSAVYNPADRVLTLTNAEIHNVLSANEEDRDGINNMGIEGLTIVLIGTNTIDVEDDGINTDFYSTTITGTGSLTITSDFGISGAGSNTKVSIVDGCSVEIDAAYWGISIEMADLLIRNASVQVRGEYEFSVAAHTLTLEGCEITSPDGAQWNPQHQMVEDENNQPVTDLVVISPLRYHLFVKGIQVTSMNASDVLGDGTVSYDPAQKVLTFNNVNIHEDYLANAVQNQDIEGLTIQLIGENTINIGHGAGTSCAAFDINANTTIKGPGTLNVIWEIGFESHAGVELTICDGCLIDVTAEDCGFHTDDYSTLTIRDSEVRTIGNRYSLYTAYLELEGCSITQPQGAEWHHGHCSVTLNGEDVKTQIVISPESLPLWVGGTQVTTINAFDILGDGKAVYDRYDNILTLKNANVSTMEYGITNQIPNLTIKLEGTSNVEGELGGIYTDGDLHIQGPGTLYSSGGDGMMIDDANLYFEEGCTVFSNGNGGVMYAGICGKIGYSMTVTNSSVYAQNTNPDASGQIFGFKNLNLAGCSITSPADAVWNKNQRQVCVNNIPVTTQVCITPEMYDLFVAGIQVSSANSSDVLGDGTVSFNPSDFILTLNNADFEYYSTDFFNPYPNGIDAGLEYLVITLIGENSIKAGHHGINMLDGTLIIQGEGNLSITASGAGIFGSGSTNLELNSCDLTVDGTLNGIVVNENGTIQIDGAILKTRGETYGSLMAGNIIMNGVEVSQPYDAFIGQFYMDGMYYAIDENDNIATEWVWIEPLNSFEGTVNHSWYNEYNWSRGTRPTANSKVYINADCTIDRYIEVDEIFIKGDNVLLIGSDGILETNLIAGENEDSSIEDDQLVMLRGGQILYYGNNLNGTIETSVDAWGEGTGWTLISSPLLVTDLEDNTDFLDVAGNQYDLYRYVESNRHNNEWENYKRGGFDEFEKGRGYLYANVNAVSHSFHGAFNIDAVTYTATYTEPEDDYPLAGFNLIGNPYIHTIYKGNGAAINNANLDNGYYTLSDAGTWVAQTDDTPIPPCTGILVRTSATTNVTINNTMDEPNLNKGGSRTIFVVNGQGFNDQVILSEGTGKSLVKLNHMNAAAPMLYCTEDGKDYAIVEKPNLEGQFALGFKAATEGTYTISLSESNRGVTLIDTLTGVKTELNKGAYTFKASPDDSTDRFMVVF